MKVYIIRKWEYIGIGEGAEPKIAGVFLDEEKAKHILKTVFGTDIVEIETDVLLQDTI